MPYLQFKGKTAVENYHHTVPHHVLEFDPELSVLGSDQKPSLDGNLIIEGDNLIALKALLPTHARRIKCIYIDPPYNTGNEGWIYNDNLTQPQFKEWIGKVVGKEGEDATRHDKWCCMMYPRLQLLKELLRDDGAIFVSIDDAEIAHLRIMMDEIFGPENQVAEICWQKKYSASNDHKGIAPMHDFLLCYQRTTLFKRNLLPRTKEQDKAYKSFDGDSRGPWKSTDYTCNKTKGERPNLYYPITNPVTGAEVWPDEKRVWAFSEDVTEENIRDRRLWWGKDGANSAPALKNFLAEVQAGLVPHTWWSHEDVGHTDEAKKEVQRILGTAGATITPKPVDLIRRVVQIGSADDDLVLDSFAGSGTTGHAVLALNAEDGVQRRFILVQLKFDSKENEKFGLNICQAITAERVKRVINGYSFDRRSAARTSTQRVPGLGGSFTYAHVGPRLVGQYKELSEPLPSYEELAKYIFYTETSKGCDPQDLQKETGRIGRAGHTSYYLLYDPHGGDAQALTLPWLTTTAEKDDAKEFVVYCEKIWAHRDDLARFKDETKRTVRPMVVPFNLK